MHILQRLNLVFRDIAADTRGNIIIIVGLGIFALISAVGASIDLGRAQRVQSRLSNALDSAGLAAGAVVNSADIDATANRYFNMNFPASPEVTVSPLTIVVSDDKLTIDLSVTAQVQTAFMKIVGYPSVTVSAQSQITRANKGLELVLVMDNTGSMTSSAGGGISKIQAAKDAATDLVNILYGDETTVENLWIGLVPFAQAVNIGPARTTWVNGTFTWGTTSWMGCVDARETSNRDVTDDLPSVAKFPRYYWPCDTNNKWYGTNSSHNNCSTGSGLQYKSGLGTSLGPNKNCSQQITPMTSDKDTILNGIASMQAVGNTHIVLGAGWGWRMLSPTWRGWWGGEMDTEQLPLDYNTPLMNKAVILMTDGDNTIDNTTRGAYWYLSNGKLGTTNQTNAVNQLNSRLTTVCTNMKNNGIIIYSIALGTSISSAAQSILQSCASKPEYYFDSPTTDDLSQAFHIIGDSLANLRISK